MHLTAEQISLIANALLVVSTLIVRILGKRVPSAWSVFVTNISPEDIDYAITTIGTKAGRKAYVKSELRALCNKYGISELVTDKDLETIMNYGVRYWNAGVKFATSRVSK
ncbi:MAG: hypothetical protein ABFD54_04535 [Armatimonadota bacterium]